MAQLEPASNALRQIRVAAQTPLACFNNAPVNFTNESNSHFREYRTAAGWLADDGLVALRLRQSDRAHADLHALAQLVRFYRGDPYLAFQRLRLSLAGVALQLTRAALAAPGWSEEQLAAWQKDWEGLDFVESMEYGLAGERAVAEALVEQMRLSSARGRVDLMQTILVGRRNPSPRTADDYFLEYVAMPLWRASAEVDEREMIKYYQQALESLRRLRQGIPASEVHRQLQTQQKEIEAMLGSKLGGYRFIVCGLFITPLERTSPNVISTEAQRVLTVTAIALERFCLRHGKFPSALDELTPHFVSGVPVSSLACQWIP